MSTKSMKANMLKNQKSNRLTLEKISKNIGFNRLPNDHTRLQEELASFTAKNNLSVPVNQSVFQKTSFEKEQLKSLKSSHK